MYEQPIKSGGPAERYVPKFSIGKHPFVLLQVNTNDISKTVIFPIRKPTGLIHLIFVR
jgi:hypothetical protein